MYPVVLGNFRLLLCVATSWSSTNQLTNQKQTKWWRMRPTETDNLRCVDDCLE